MMENHHQQQSLVAGAPRKSKVAWWDFFSNCKEASDSEDEDTSYAHHNAMMLCADDGPIKSTDDDDDDLIINPPPTPDSSIQTTPVKIIGAQSTHSVDSDDDRPDTPGTHADSYSSVETTSSSTSSLPDNDGALSLQSLETGEEESDEGEGECSFVKEHTMPSSQSTVIVMPSSPNQTTQCIEQQLLPLESQSIEDSGEDINEGEEECIFIEESTPDSPSFTPITDSFMSPPKINTPQCIKQQPLRLLQSISEEEHDNATADLDDNGTINSNIDDDDDETNFIGNIEIMPISPLLTTYQRNIRKNAYNLLKRLGEEESLFDLNSVEVEQEVEEEGEEEYEEQNEYAQQQHGEVEVDGLKHHHGECMDMVIQLHDDSQSCPSEHINEDEVLSEKVNQDDAKPNDEIVGELNTTISDLRNELQARQIQSLEAQLHHALEESSHHLNKIDEHEKSIDSLNEVVNRSHSEYEKIVEELMVVRKENDELHAKISDLTNDLQSATGQTEQDASRIQLLEAQLRHALEESSQRLDEMHAYEKSIDSLNEAVNQSHLDYEKIAEELIAVRKENEDLTARLLENDKKQEMESEDSSTSTTNDATDEVLDAPFEDNLLVEDGNALGEEDESASITACREEDDTTELAMAWTQNSSVHHHVRGPRMSIEEHLLPYIKLPLRLASFLFSFWVTIIILRILLLFSMMFVDDHRLLEADGFNAPGVY